MQEYNNYIMKELIINKESLKIKFNYSYVIINKLYTILLLINKEILTK